MWKEQRRERAEYRAKASKAKAEARQIAVNLLRSELEVAVTLIRVAETTSNWETALRNLRNAGLALKGVEEFAKKLELDLPERGAFRGYGRPSGDSQKRESREPNRLNDRNPSESQVSLVRALRTLGAIRQRYEV